MVKRMTVAKALDYFHKSVFSNEVLEKYVCCKEGIILITKSMDEDFEDDFVVGDVVYYLVTPSGSVIPTTPGDCNFNFRAVKYL